MALVYSPQPTVVAGTFTTNRVKAAPVRVSAAHLRSPDVRAILANAGNANACTGASGIENAKRMTKAAALALGLRERQVMVCSTGRIGVPLPIERMEATIAQMPAALAPDGSRRAAEAIMTSDTFAKEIAVEFQLGERTVRIGGIAKGAGMIDPNMATMLCFLTTDAAIGETRAAAGALGLGGAVVQPHHDRRRHEHERHRAPARERPRRIIRRWRAARPRWRSSSRRSTTSRATSPGSSWRTARASRSSSRST